MGGIGEWVGDLAILISTVTIRDARNAVISDRHKYPLLSLTLTHAHAHAHSPTLHYKLKSQVSNPYSQFYETML